MTFNSIHLFGATTSTGEATKRQFSKFFPEESLIPYSRRKGSQFVADFCKPSSFHPGSDPKAFSFWFSFGPIWSFSAFLENLSRSYPERISGLKGVVACSSSSVITKRFASNPFDRELVNVLLSAEDKLLTTCSRIGISCHILQPTLIYGKVGPYEDRNLSRLISLMRRFPVIPVPSHTGLRQPIHASQLAAVALSIARDFKDDNCNPIASRRIALGGDVELSYGSMLESLRQSLHDSDPARRCRFLSVPNRLFHAAAFPLLLVSPKYFEALLRVSADLSGFMPSHQLLNARPQLFPLDPSY